MSRGRSAAACTPAMTRPSERSAEGVDLPAAEMVALFLDEPVCSAGRAIWPAPGAMSTSSSPRSCADAPVLLATWLGSPSASTDAEGVVVWTVEIPPAGCGRGTAEVASVGGLDDPAAFEFFFFRTWGLFGKRPPSMGKVRGRN